MLDRTCKPVSHTVIRIHQADRKGRYDHPDDDDAPKAIDPHFQYWGYALTDSSGYYYFKTIRPGPYPVRAPHIHYYVDAPGHSRFITESYFKNHPHNSIDGNFNILTKAEQERMALDFQSTSDLKIPGLKLETAEIAARFDIILPG